MARETLNSPAPPSRAALWLAVPLTAASLGALGWLQAARLRSGGSAEDPALAVAVLAAGACLAVAGWWIGGLAMLALAATARRLHWAGLERWATRLTPGVVARAAAAVVGIQLAVVTPAHADDAALDPFWGTAPTGTEQLSDPGGQSGAPDAAAANAAAPGGGAAATGAGLGAGATGENPGREAPSPDSAGASTTDPRVTDAHSSEVPSGGTPSATDLPSGGGNGAVHTSAQSPSAAGISPSNPPAPQRVVDGVVTVMAGDTLWDLTAQLLGPDASETTVSENLASWLEHNTLAEHGDLIHPGDQLHVPPHLLTQPSARG